MRKLFYLALTAFFIYLWFRLVDVNQVASAVIDVNWYLILLALFLGTINSFIGAVRLKTLLGVIADIPALFIWGLGYVAALISLIFPFSAGGFSFAYIIAKKTKSSYAKSFAVVFLNFMIGVVLTLALALIALIYFYQKKILTVRVGDFTNTHLLLILGITALLLVGFLITYRKKFKAIQNLLERVRRGIALFSGSRTILTRTAILTAMMLVLGAVASYINFMAFGMRPPIIDYLLATSLFGVLGMIPGVPAKIGQYETFGVLTLPYLLNLDKNSIFAMLLLTHMVSITTTFVLGWISLYYLKLDLGLVKNLSDKYFSKRRGQKGHS